MKTILSGALIVLTLTACNGSDDATDNTVCFTLYEPVCAKAREASACSSEPCPTHQYNTFSNSCFAGIAKAQQAFLGECGTIENRPVFDETPIYVVADTEDQPDEGVETSILSSSIEDDVLYLDVQYAGGCDTHSFSLFAIEPFMESLPVQLPLILQHQTEDTCEALIQQQLAFDLVPLQETFHRNYQESTGEILLNMDGTSILYVW